jgi:hypothetical protein
VTAAFLCGPADAALPFRTYEAPAGAQVSASHVNCELSVIPFTSGGVPPGGLLLSGNRNVSVIRIHAFQIARPELFPFQRFQANSMRGTLSDGCPFIFWWKGSPAAGEGEIRVLSATPPLDRSIDGLQLAPDPPPAWSPVFDGYRHVMSSRIWSGPSYIGLWNRADGGPGSLVATYGAEGEPVARLGTTNWTYEGIYAAPDVHMLVFALVNAPQGSEPLYIATFARVQPGACCRVSRRRR